MPTTMSAAAEAALGEHGASVIRRLFLIRDLLNADLRQTVEITDRVLELGTLGGDSTIVKSNWEKVGMTPTLILDDYLMPDGPDSIWAQWGKQVTDCHILFTISVALPGGKLEVLKTYYGEINDYEPTMVGDVAAIALVTLHATNKALSKRMTKATGDETVVLGDTW